MIGDRVAFYDYLAIPQKGTVIYEKPHSSEQDIMWLGILLDMPELNTIEIVNEISGGIMTVGAYIRSDEVHPLIE